MGNLLDLISGLEAGNTIISLGRDIYGVWGLLQLFESYSAAETVANPFIMASNKQKAVVNVGEVRRVVTSQIIQNQNTTTNSFDDMDATLKVEVTPQINSDGMIMLDIVVSIVNFLSGSTDVTVAQQKREIKTKAIVADREVLALGGLIKNNSTQTWTKVPGLGDVPILGWLFKNENKNDERDNLLILFSPQIIDPLVPEAARRFTQRHIDDYYGTLDAMRDPSEKHDPIYRMFFEEDKKCVNNRVQDFIFEKPKKRTKKAEAELAELKKEHPALADQPEVLEAMSLPEAKKKDRGQKVVQHTGHGKSRSKVSLTADAQEQAVEAA
jgi:type II secretory pathway component GspD/PulD (secretin)